MNIIGIIGGTGVYNPSLFNNLQKETLTTPYGDINYTRGEYKDKVIIFLPRHGSEHTIPPHLINYRANIWGLKKLGVQAILSTTAVGSLNPKYQPGDFVLTDQFIDFTKTRVSTFYDNDKKGVVHLDVTNPYCSRLRNLIAEIGKSNSLSIHNGGTYVCTEGPRFETPAEIKMFAKLGGDLVGMTNVPEVVLANEAEICYATISLVTNYAAGISTNPLTYQEVIDLMKAGTDNLQRLILSTIDAINLQEDCPCQHRLAEYGGFKL